jgi:hypothetical protein
LRIFTIIMKKFRAISTKLGILLYSVGEMNFPDYL